MNPEPRLVANELQRIWDSPCRLRLLAPLLLAPFMAAIAFVSNAVAEQLPGVRPGGIVALAIERQPEAHEPPLIRFGRRRVLTLREIDRWVALVGIARDTVPGDYIISVRSDDRRDLDVRFRVEPGEDIGVIANDDPASIRSFKFNADLAPNLPLIEPTFGQIRKPFSLNFSAHEIETKDGETVVSPGDGIVHSITPAGPTGDRVVIDHGHGAFSILSPVYELRAKEQESVVKSQIIGVTGAMTAAAVSGLRWQLSLNNSLVDPQELLFWPDPDEERTD